DARRVVAAHLDAAVTEPCPEASRGLREVAHPVVDQPDLHAFGRFRDQRIGELETDLVLADEVRLEMHAPLRFANRAKPRGIVLVRIAEQLDAVAVDQRGARRARERIVEDLVQRTIERWAPRDARAGAGHGRQRFFAILLALLVHGRAPEYGAIARLAESSLPAPAASRAIAKSGFVAARISSSAARSASARCANFSSRSRPVNTSMKRR